jgi:hypothetical protein
MKNISFTTDYLKTVDATVRIKDDNVDIIDITINGVFYNKTICSKHQWLLYKAIKNHLND